MTSDELVSAIGSLAWCDGVVCGMEPYINKDALPMINLIDERLTKVLNTLRREYDGSEDGQD